MKTNNHFYYSYWSDIESCHTLGVSFKGNTDGYSVLAGIVTIAFLGAIRVGGVGF